MFKGKQFYDKKEKATRLEMNECECFCNLVDNFIIKAYKIADNFSLVEITLNVHSFITDTLLGKMHNTSLLDVPFGQIDDLCKELRDKVFWNLFDKKTKVLIFDFIYDISKFSIYTIQECYENDDYFGTAYSSKRNGDDF